MTTTVAIAVATLGVRALGTAKEVVVAGQFGVNDSIDAFVIALAVFLLVDAVLVQSMTSAFMPAYVHTGANEGPASALRLASVVMGRSMAVAAVVALCLVAVAHPLFEIVASGFAPPKRDQAVSAFLILLPALVLQCTSTVARALLNAADRFILPASAPAAIPVITVCMIVVTGPARLALPIATTVGFAIETVVLVVHARRLGLVVRPRLGGSSRLQEVASQYWPAVGAALLMGSSAVIDQAMAAGEAPGSAAMYAYGARVVSLVLGVSALAIGTAVLPYYARLVAMARWNDISGALRFQCTVLIAIAVPPTAVVALASEPIVRVLFQRGEFTAANTSTVADIQALLVLQVPAYLIGIVGVRLLSALRRNRALTWISAVNLVVDVLSNILFLRWLGLPGLALSTSVVYGLSTTVILVVVRSELAKKGRLPAPADA